MFKDWGYKKLGDYELLRFIRSEGDTEVHEALQLSIDRKVALVLLNPKLSENENSVNGFRELVRAKAQVSHPHIAAIYEGHEEEEDDQEEGETLGILYTDSAR